MSRLETSSLRLELKQRLETQIADRVCARPFEEDRQGDTQVLQFTGFGAQSYDVLTPKKELVTKGVLGERNIAGLNQRISRGDGFGSQPGMTKGVPERGHTRTPNVKATAKRHEAIHLPKDAGQRRRHARHKPMIVYCWPNEDDVVKLHHY